MSETKTRSRLLYSPAETLAINVDRLEAEAVKLRPKVARLAIVERELTAYRGALELLDGLTPSEAPTEQESLPLDEAADGADVEVTLNG